MSPLWHALIGLILLKAENFDSAFLESAGVLGEELILLNSIGNPENWTF